jgi:hypothetical protein
VKPRPIVHVSLRAARAVQNERRWLHVMCSPKCARKGETGRERRPSSMARLVQLGINGGKFRKAIACATQSLIAQNVTTFH